MAAKKAPQPIKHTKAMERATAIMADVQMRAKGLRDVLDQIEQVANPDLTAAELAHIYMCVQTVNDALADALSPISSEWSRSGIYRKLNEQIVPQAFERESTTSITSAEGYRITVSSRYFASMKSQPACFEWLKKNGMGDLIQPTVNASTLSSAGKALLEEGKELDDELFECYFKSGVSVTKTKK